MLQSCVLSEIWWWSAFVCCKFYSHLTWCYDMEIPGKNLNFGSWPPLFVILRSILWMSVEGWRISQPQIPSYPFRWSIFVAVLLTSEAENLTMQKHTTWSLAHILSHPKKWNTELMTSQFSDFFSPHPGRAIQRKARMASALAFGFANSHRFPNHTLSND